MGWEIYNGDGVSEESSSQLPAHPVHSRIDSHSGGISRGNNYSRVNAHLQTSVLRDHPRRPESVASQCSQLLAARMITDTSGREVNGSPPGPAARRIAAGMVGPTALLEEGPHAMNYGPNFQLCPGT